MKFYLSYVGKLYESPTELNHAILTVISRHFWQEKYCRPVIINAEYEL